MTQETVLTLIQDGIMTVIKVSAPPLLVALLVGVLISILQATTQINEQTLAFVPKVLCVMLTLVIFGGWMLQQLEEFMVRVYEYTRLVSLMWPWA